MDSRPPVWARNYVGIPFVDYGRSIRGLDCWGLFRLILKEQANVNVPEYDTLGYLVGDKENNGRVATVMQEDIKKGIWLSVGPEDVRVFDGILLRILGLPIHVGVVVSRGYMIHTEKGIDSCLERYDRAMWSKRITGIYRYNGTAANA